MQAAIGLTNDRPVPRDGRATPARVLRSGSAPWFTALQVGEPADATSLPHSAADDVRLQLPHPFDERAECAIGQVLVTHAPAPDLIVFAIEQL